MVVYISEVSETHNSTSVLVVDDILLNVHLVNEEENHLLPLFIALRFQQLEKLFIYACRKSNAGLVIVRVVSESSL